MYEATPEDQYLIIMSDGISEFIPSQVQAVQLSSGPWGQANVTDVLNTLRSGADAFACRRLWHSCTNALRVACAHVRLLRSWSRKHASGGSCH